jgi:hypothetical protein
MIGRDEMMRTFIKSINNLNYSAKRKPSYGNNNSVILKVDMN